MIVAWVVCRKLVNFFHADRSHANGRITIFYKTQNNMPTMKWIQTKSPRQIQKLYFNTSAEKSGYFISTFPFYPLEYYTNAARTPTPRPAWDFGRWRCVEPSNTTAVQLAYSKNVRRLPTDLSTSQQCTRALDSRHACVHPPPVSIGNFSCDCGRHAGHCLRHCDYDVIGGDCTAAQLWNVILSGALVWTRLTPLSPPKVVREELMV